MNFFVNPDERFAASLRREREARRWSRGELAEAARGGETTFHQSTIYKIENGQRKVSIGEAVWLARALGLEPSDMYASDASVEAMQRRLAICSELILRESLEMDELAERICKSQAALRDAIEEFDEVGDYLTNEDDSPTSAAQHYGELANDALFRNIRDTLRSNVRDSPSVRALFDDYGTTFADLGHGPRKERTK